MAGSVLATVAHVIRVTAASVPARRDPVTGASFPMTAPSIKPAGKELASTSLRVKSGVPKEHAAKATASSASSAWGTETAQAPSTAMDRSFCVAPTCVRARIPGVRTGESKRADRQARAGTRRFPVTQMRFARSSKGRHGVSHGTAPRVNASARASGSWSARGPAPIGPWLPTALTRATCA